MFAAAHWVITTTYLLLPAIVLGYAVGRDDRRTQLKGFALTFIPAAMLAVGFSLIYALIGGSRVTVLQVLLATYFAASMLFLVKLFDVALRWSLRTILFIPRDRTSLTPALVLRAAFGGMLRLTIGVMVVLPYVMCCLMTYRPKLAAAGDPRTQAGLDFESITFPATDNVRLAGWWVPSAGSASSQTVLLVHGLAGDKSKQPVLLRELANSGFNVLAFDLRDHGDSAGQLTSFGDVERRDVLGALRWLQANHPHEAQRISGVGASVGAAALIAAAADSGEEGRAISAIACYEAYDGATGLARTVTRDYFIPPLGWLVRNVGIRLASAQTGANLNHFQVQPMLPRLWPRPILFIHAMNDSLVNFSHGQRLYENATQPKYYLWLEKTDYDAALKSRGAAQTVVKFLQTAQDVPVI